MVGWRRRRSSSPATITSPTAKTRTPSAITTGTRPPGLRYPIPAIKWFGPRATLIARRPPLKLTWTTTTKIRPNYYGPLPGDRGEGFLFAPQTQSPHQPEPTPQPACTLLLRVRRGVENRCSHDPSRRRLQLPA